MTALSSSRDMIKDNRLFILAVLANCSALALCLLSRFDLVPTLALPIYHACLFFLNRKAAKHWWQVIFLSVLHIISTICTIILDARIYTHYYGIDPADVVFHVFSLYIGTGITVVLFIIQLLQFRKRIKQRSLIQAEYPGTARPSKGCGKGISGSNSPVFKSERQVSSNGQNLHHR